jgi:hypothetical protein
MDHILLRCRQCHLPKRCDVFWGPRVAVVAGVGGMAIAGQAGTGVRPARRMPAGWR